MPNGVRFGVLGTLQLRVDGVEVPLGTPKQRVILAMLLLNRNHPMSIDTLIDAAWNCRPPTGGRTTVYSYVSNLRRIMGNVGMNPHAVLASAPPGYRLSVPDSQCDLARFASNKTAGLRAAAAGHFDHASSYLSAALAEWRGAVLEDLREFSCVGVFAGALAEDKLVVQTVYAEAEIACGRAHSVIGELEVRTAEHPYREPLWSQLITAYYMAERQSDAVDAYHRLKTLLAEDLGIEPGPTVRELYQQILHQQPVMDRRTAYPPEDVTISLEQHSNETDGSPVAALRDAMGRTHQVHGTATRIGRSPINEVVLSDTKVSRLHAAIVNTGTGFMITDLRSANGVFVSGERVRVSADLRDGDRIRIGQEEFTFELFLNPPDEAP